MEYKNLWYNKRNKNSKETFNNKPIKTIGEFTICKHSDIEYHIVYNSFCVGMNSGINGAIDRIINRSDDLKKQYENGFVYNNPQNKNSYEDYLEIFYKKV